jgi:hypothetical protein
MKAEDFVAMAFSPSPIVILSHNQNRSMDGEIFFSRGLKK